MTGNRDEYGFKRAGDETASQAVIRALASVLDVEPTTLHPLNGVIPCDALNTLIDADEDITVSFSYEGIPITVCSDGHLVIRDSP